MYAHNASIFIARCIKSQMADKNMGKYRQRTTYGGREGISPHILNLETRRRYAISLRPLLFYDCAIRSGSRGEKPTLLL
jgi:hypothetical protein